MKTFEDWFAKRVYEYNASWISKDELAQDAWNAATEAAKPRWIPVSERLPDKEGRYPMKFLGFDSFWIIHYKPGITVFDGEITHWTELPSESD